MGQPTDQLPPIEQDDNAVRSTPGPWWHSPYVPAMLAGAALILIGLLLPWVTLIAPFIGKISRSGLDTSDGKVILGAAVLLAVLIHQEASRPRAGLRVLITLLCIAIVGVILIDAKDAADIIASMDSELVHAEIGVGMWISGAGAAISAFAVTLRSKAVWVGLVARA